MVGLSSKLSYPNSCFKDFLWQYEIISSELTVSKNWNCLLSERIIQLERNTVNNAQYHRCESLEINPVPPTIKDVLESILWKALSLTGLEEKTDDLQGWQHLKKKDNVTIKFKCRKQKCSSLINRKNLQKISDVLIQLNLSG